MEICAHFRGIASGRSGQRRRGRTLLWTAALPVLLAGFTALASLLTPSASAALLSDRGAGYTAVLYDSTSGLPTSDVNALVQSREGFLWIGGYSGLIRYDGSEFYRYDSSTGVSSVVSLFEDSRQRLWIGTNDSGIGVLENEQFRFYDREEGLRSSSVRALLEDRNGNILAATTMGLAYVDTEEQLHILDDPQINTEYICELVMDSEGTVWGVTLSGACFSVENLRLTGFYSAQDLGYGVVNTLSPDPDHPGFVWLGTQESAVLYGEPARMGEAEAVSVEPLHQVNCIRLIDGLLWIVSDNGVGFFRQDGSFHLLEDIPMGNSIEKVMEDFEGNLWFNSTRQGMMKIVPNRFTDISRMAGLPPLVVNSTCLWDGLLYIGADTGLTLLDPDMVPVENALTELLQGVRIRSIHADSAGNLWFCTNSSLALLRYRPDTGEVRSYNPDNGLASNRARTLLELSDGTIAVATNAGTNLIRDGEIVGLYNAAQGISNLEILTLEEAPDGRLYMGSDGDGIYVADHGRVSRLGREDGLASEVILRVKRDPEDRELYWIVTSNSLAWMKDDKITTIRHFPYSNNFDLYFDGSGRAWILSSNGVYVVKKADLLADERIDYTLYDTKCGLPCAATANSYSWLTEDGTLYLAASTGVSSVDISDTADGNANVRLSVPFLMADDTYIPVPEDGTVTIPAGCRRLNIYNYAFTYTLNNPHVRFWLRGFDQSPVTVTKQDMAPASYTNLPGGTYQFHMAVLDTMTGDEEQGISVTIIKEKTLYERLWFRALLVLAAAAAAAGVVALYFHQKTLRLLRKQEENRLFINEMTSAFASCIDMKDAYTNGHSHRVAKYTAMLAEKLGKPKEEIEEIYNIALLHDVGKISIPDSILNKPGKLTEEEFQIMKSHSERGYEILKEISIAPQLALGAGFHHERLDGRGYPRGITGDQIPEIAQIIAVADTFDAMYSTRPYRKRLPLDYAASEIQKAAGTQLNPKVVEAFMELVREGAFDDV